VGVRSEGKLQIVRRGVETWGGAKGGGQGNHPYRKVPNTKAKLGSKPCERREKKKKNEGRWAKWPSEGSVKKGATGRETGGRKTGAGTTQKRGKSHHEWV